MPDRFGDKIRLQHVLDAITEIQSFTKDVNYEDFQESSLIQSACVRQLEIIGEACNHLSKDLMDQNSQIPWSEIIGLRTIIVHQYFGVDINVIWDVIQVDLSELAVKAKDIIEKME
jgi:uncharacterized protein with HEPN domain